MGSAVKTPNTLVITPSLCNAALQGQITAKRTMLERTGVPESMKKFYFNLQGFNQYGLLHDERQFRLQRAAQCTIVKGVLPKEQWSTWEQHKEKGFYLQPYIDEIIKENDEKEAWNKN